MARYAGGLHSTRQDPKTQRSTKRRPVRAAARRFPQPDHGPPCPTGRPLRPKVVDRLAARRHAAGIHSRGGSMVRTAFVAVVIVFAAAPGWAQNSGPAVESREPAVLSDGHQPRGAHPADARVLLRARRPLPGTATRAAMASRSKGWCSPRMTSPPSARPVRCCAWSNSSRPDRSHRGIASCHARGLRRGVAEWVAPHPHANVARRGSATAEDP